MFSIKVEVTIPDFNKHPIEIDCPYCGLHTWVTLGEIQRREAVVCRGCKVMFVMEDHLGQVKRTIKTITKTLKKLEM